MTLINIFQSLWMGWTLKKTLLPVLQRYTKDESPLQQCLIGVKVHGKRNYVFLVDSTVPGGGNLILEILRQVLNDLGERNELPTKNPTLYLQFDNCGEIRTRQFLHSLWTLCDAVFFSKIKVGILMVGHTHEDIDSFFSTIATKLKSGIVCPDMESLEQAIHDAFDKLKDKPLIKHLNGREMIDYKKLYDPVIDSSTASSVPYPAL